MSKFILIKRTTGFTTVSNNIVHCLKNDLQALGFYVYLLSLPDNWQFYKTCLSKECGVGIKKVETLLRKLKACGLVKYGQIRNERGRFEKFFMEIYDVEQINDPESPDGNSCRTVKTVGRIGEAIKEEVIKEVKINIKKESSKSVDIPEKSEKRSLCLINDDFFPDDERRELLTVHAKRTNQSEQELFQKFEDVSRRYKTRSKDWQLTFQSFLEQELPKRVYEDEKGRRLRYDNVPTNH